VNNTQYTNGLDKPSGKTVCFKNSRINCFKEIVQDFVNAVSNIIGIHTLNNTL
jgi:hypothetical protein